ncbi:MAG: T9SS type A sorting domain-containing protein [Candidatus Marinimicrobia bacterium]|nr:T9SS type A sorting domain-containing protein [Candidatus Neomarinimicrobiota bacterium]
MGRPRNAVILHIMILMLTVPCLIAQAIDMAVVNHNLGTFGWRVDPMLFLETSGTRKPTGSWPQGVYDSEQFLFYWCIIATESYVDSAGIVQGKQTKKFLSLPDPSEYDAPWGLFEYRRDMPPLMTIDGYPEGDDFSGVIDISQSADIMSVLRLKAEPGLWITLKTYSFSNQNHDDYVINHMNIEYTRNWEYADDFPDIPAQSMENVYFSLAYLMQPSFAGMQEVTGHRWGGDAYDDWVDWESRVPTVDSGLDANRPDMILGYGWDGDDTDIAQLEPGGSYFNDTGDPSFLHDQKGQLLSYQFPGYTLLHADQSPTDPTDDPSQPHTIALSDVYNVWNSSYSGIGEYDFISSGAMQHPPDWEDPNNSHWSKSDLLHMGIGPYNFEEGEDIDIVWAIGVGGIPWDSTVTKGAEWLRWYRGEPGATFIDEAKRDYIHQGLDSLHKNLSHARWAWDRIRNSEPIPTPPRSPNLTVESMGDHVHLTWEDLSAVPDAVTGVPDLAGYRIYRKNYKALINFASAEFGLGHGYDLLAELGTDETSYDDYRAAPEGYPPSDKWYYYVTAVDDGTQNFAGLFPGQSLESSHYANRHSHAVVANLDSMTPAPNQLPGFIALSNNYPNPFNSTTLIKYGLNEPGDISLYVYDLNGRVVRTLARDSHLIGWGETYWDGTHDNGDIVAAGVYFCQLQVKSTTTSWTGTFRKTIKMVLIK